MCDGARGLHAAYVRNFAFLTFLLFLDVIDAFLSYDFFLFKKLLIWSNNNIFSRYVMYHQ